MSDDESTIDLSAVLDEKLDFLNSVSDSVSMNMIAYEYAVRAGVDPKVAAHVHHVDDIINGVSKEDNL